MVTEVSNPQSQTKLAGTLKLDEVSPIPLINVGKCRAFSTKRDKIPDFEHCKWDEGDNLFGVPTLPSGIAAQTRRSILPPMHQPF